MGATSSVAFPAGNDGQGGKTMVKITINYKKCKQCHYCVTFCPNRVFEEEADGSPAVKFEEKCSVCQLCVKRCPDFAIKVEG